MDFIKDNNPTGIDFVKLELKNAGFTIPKYIEESETKGLDKESITKLASAAFADDITKEYPINSKENIWKSAAYLFTNGVDKQQIKESKLNKIANNIIKASEMFGIKEDIDNILSVLTSSFNKQASTESGLYALSLEDEESGELKNYLPINNVFEIVKSAGELDELQDSLIPEYYYTACNNLLKVAKAKNIDIHELPTSVVEAGTPRIFNYDLAIKQANTRKEKTGDDMYIELVNNAKYASEVANNFNTMEYATTMFDLDKLHSEVLGRYNKTDLLNPVAVFSGGETREELEKFANEHVLFQNIFIPTEEFLKQKETISMMLNKTASEKIINALKASDTITAASALQELSKSDQIDLLKVLVKS